MIVHHIDELLRECRTRKVRAVCVVGSTAEARAVERDLVPDLTDDEPLPVRVGPWWYKYPNGSTLRVVYATGGAVQLLGLAADVAYCSPEVGPEWHAEVRHRLVAGGHRSGEVAR